MIPVEMQIIPYHVGQNLDIKDSVGKWINAEVLFAGNGVIYVHYSGWSLKYDQQIPINSPRILQQWQPGKQIKVNNRIDVFHQVGGWLEARVIQVGEQSQKHQSVKVHFFNYHSKYDTYVNLKSNNQVAIIGSRSKAFGMGKKRRKALNSLDISEKIKKLLQLRTKNLKQNLQINDLTIKSSQGDGNCLFRSISDQLYGNQDHHLQIRKICMDYITYEKQFFQDFISQDINKYIQQKRASGVWGDDVQIQAISEIYARPIQIYVFDNKPIRTFHQENEQKVAPIRLAYVGCCHYDSIKPKDLLNQKLINTQFGLFQQLFMTTYKSDMMNNIVRNRNLFSNCDRLQDTIQEHLLAQQRQELKIQDQLSKALQVSQTQAILEQIQKSQLKQLQIKYQQQKIQQEIKKIQQKEMQQVKKRSKKQDIRPQKPYWFQDLVIQGFSQKQIWFAIQCKGFDPDAVQNFLLDNLCI